MGEEQVLLVDKPAGLSSFGVVGRVRYFLSQRAGHKVKVGHTGTLDPFATGLLILLTGKATKRSNEFLKLDKEYVATVKFGFVSTTGDTEGEITPYGGRSSGLSLQADSLNEARKPQLPLNEVIPPSQDTISKLLSESFTGEITQTPPAYSAIKINGQRAYKLARAGKQVEMPSREVTIYEIEILEYKWSELVLRVKCSSGTYIRSLAADIGEALGVGAYLTALRRTKVGVYGVEDAHDLDFFA